MKLRTLAALAFGGLLASTIPLTASAHDTATCGHRPGWADEHPNWYNGWWQKNCSWRSDYSQSYYGYGERRYYGDRDADDWYRVQRRHWHHDRDDWDHDLDRH